MAKLDQLARPMMRRPRSLEPHPTRRQRSEKLQQLIAPDRLGDHNAPRSINAMDLKNVLGQIEPTVVTNDKFMIDFPTGVAPSDVVSTTTISARLFIEPDAARATATPLRERTSSSSLRAGWSSPYLLDVTMPIGQISEAF
jgi:hypothetical protein